MPSARSPLDSKVTGLRYRGPAIPVTGIRRTIDEVTFMGKPVHLDTIREYVNLLPTTIGSLISAGNFPQPISDANGMPVWDLDDVKRFRENAVANPTRIDECL